MSQDLWKEVDDYIAARFIPPSPELDAALQNSAASNLPSINVSPTQGKFLYMLAQIQRAERILEIGTLGGYSTIWLAKGLAKGGRLITLEYEPKHAVVARENISRAGLSHLVEIRVGKALDLLPALETEKCGPFDLIFIDADKVNTPGYFTWALKLSRPGTLILVDNLIRKGGIINENSTDETVLGMRRFCEMVGKEPRVTATALQTVGSKGYDGFALVTVNR